MVAPPTSTHPTHQSHGGTHHASGNVLGEADPLAPGVVAVLGGRRGNLLGNGKGRGGPPAPLGL